jgi:zinc D-Ala-D-Ala carboxypeptidase
VSTVVRPAVLTVPQCFVVSTVARLARSMAPSFGASKVVRSARLTAPSPPARRNSTTRRRVWPSSIQPCFGALRQAAIDAGDDGVTFIVNSGWRSPAYEDQLRREAIAKYGSVQEAARWVATGTTSAHVKGDAVHIGPSGAAAWLSEHGAAYGLCQIYANEPWHYELRPEAIAHGCPAMYADPTHDPRMQQ